MKQFLALCLVVLSAWLVCPEASASNPAMEEFANKLNEQMDGVVSVVYEEPNIVFNFPETYFDNETAEIFAALSPEEMQMLAEPMKNAIASGMDAEDLAVIANILKEGNANLIVRLNVKGAKKEILLTPDQLIE